MDRTIFLRGLKVFWASGGSNPDEATLEIWFNMLCHIDPADYEKAIIHLMRNEKNLGVINFIAEIEERALIFKNSRESEQERNQRQLPPPNMIPREKLQALIKDFTASLGDIPKETDDN